jgi:hypothetical protein
MVGIEYDEASPKKPREARRATEAAAYIPQIRTAEVYPTAASKPNQRVSPIEPKC